MKRKLLTILLLLAAVPPYAAADTVTLKNGTIHEGVILQRTPDQIQLRVDKDGIKATMNIPTADIFSVTTAADAPKALPTLTTLPAEKAKPAATLPTEQLPPTKGLLVELAATVLNNGPDNPARLPDSLKNLWESAVNREVLGNKAETLEALQNLDDAFAPLKGGPERLDAVSRRARNGEPFGNWLARLHWDVVSSKFAAGQFDFKDIRESERRPLIGILKEKTAPALQPLQPYFPPIDDKTGKPLPFKPAQLAGITISNAIEVKRQATYASALLQAQLKLEPQMPTIDRAQISTQLQTVSRVLSHTLQLEPAAKAAADKIERDRKAAEDKARRGG